MIRVRYWRELQRAIGGSSRELRGQLHTKLPNHILQGGTTVVSQPKPGSLETGLVPKFITVAGLKKKYSKYTESEFLKHRIHSQVSSNCFTREKKLGSGVLKHRILLQSCIETKSGLSGDWIRCKIICNPQPKVKIVENTQNPASSKIGFASKQPAMAWQER